MGRFLRISLIGHSMRDTRFALLTIQRPPTEIVARVETTIVYAQFTGRNDWNSQYSLHG